MKKPRSGIVHDAVEDSRDHNSRRLIFGLAFLAFISLFIAGIALWKVLAGQQSDINAGQNLATQVQEACASEDLDPELFKQLCPLADDVQEQIEAGPQGIPGIPGSQGPPGVQGPIGPIGPQGSVGPMGAPGESGSDGLPGTDGEVGPQGPEGAQGEQGEQGPKGTDGEIGPIGPMGPQGAQGEQGPKGDTGPQGPEGYPNAITLTIAGSPVFTCTDPDGDHNYTCEP